MLGPGELASGKGAVGRARGLWSWAPTVSRPVGGRLARPGERGDRGTGGIGMRASTSQPPTAGAATTVPR